MGVNDYADKIMSLIREDIAAGLVPAGLTDFSELHTYVDANDYVLDAGVPFGTDAGAGAEGIGTVNAVTAEVSRRMAAEA